MHKIVEDLFRSGELNNLLDRCRLSHYSENSRLKQDFMSEIILILLTHKDPDKLIEMHERGELEYFVLRIIKNQIYSKRTRYWKQYGRWEQYRRGYDAVRE